MLYYICSFINLKFSAKFPCTINIIITVVVVVYIIFVVVQLRMIIYSQSRLPLGVILSVTKQLQFCYYCVQWLLTLKSGVKIERKFPSPTFVLNTPSPFGLLVKGVNCLVKNRGGEF